MAIVCICQHDPKLGPELLSAAGATGPGVVLLLVSEDRRIWKVGL